ncbi:hypothetical protein L7F22_015944 [Adiantum nelumboides]|nr:hypothetical protein [Adiantum nelumboides]
MRAQAKKKKHNSSDDSEGTKNSAQRAKKRRSQRYELGKQKQRELIEEKAQKLFQEKEAKSRKPKDENKETSMKSGRSILVDKIFEPINAALEAYQAGLKAGQNMKNKWKNYPSPDVKAAKLKAYQNLVRITQDFLEKQQPKLETMPKPEELVVETPKEQTGKVEKPHLKTKEPELIVPDSEDVMDGIPYVEEDWPGQLWEKFWGLFIISASQCGFLSVEKEEKEEEEEESCEVELVAANLQNEFVLGRGQLEACNTVVGLLQGHRCRKRRKLYTPFQAAPKLNKPFHSAKPFQKRTPTAYSQLPSKQPGSLQLRHDGPPTQASYLSFDMFIFLCFSL